MMLLAWRMMRPGMLPIWAGLPIGLFDDLYSGMPFGSGIVFWSATMLAMEVIDEKFLWRGFLQDWLAACALIAAYLLLTSTLAGIATGYPLPVVIVPQVMFSLVLYPVVTRLVALLDRVRLLPLKRI
ncbi:MAG: rod shape-determining protein MreD [Novosphingobium sp.]